MVPGSPFDLSGKRAWVTGARIGIGQALAIALAEAGADIIGLGPSPMPETREQIEKLGRSFGDEQVDLSLALDFQTLVAALVDRWDAPDILVNNAGIIRSEELLDYSEADWDAVVTVNQRSLFLLSQAVARVMVDRGTGRIINIASTLSFQGGVRVPAYAATKHAVAGITRAMANALAPRGVTVNAIAPGYIATGINEALRADPERLEQILSRIPVGHVGTPEDLKTSVLYLASPASSYVTGAIIAVDGGWLAH